MKNEKIFLIIAGLFLLIVLGVGIFFYLGANKRCIPRPACLDAKPACKIPEPQEGWCESNPTPTPTVSPTTPTPSVPPTPTLTPTPTPTPTPPSSSTPIGIGYDSAIVDFWNSNALSSDIALAYSSKINNLTSMTAGVKVLFTDPSNFTSSADTALANNIRYVTSNIEEPDVSTVISKEANEYQIAKSKGLTYIFGPLGILLEDNYATSDYAILRNTDYILYQAQYYQDSARELGTSDPAAQISIFGQKVKDLVSNMRPYTAQQKVWVQVSANPPFNRCISSERLIQYIDAITDGSAGSADVIIIFFSSTYDSGTDRQGNGNCVSKGLPTRAEVVKQTIQYYRAPPFLTGDVNNSNFTSSADTALAKGIKYVVLSPTEQLQDSRRNTKKTSSLLSTEQQGQA